MQLAVAQMTRQQPLPGSSSADAGTIVTIASIAAHQASKDQFTSDYCMSKGAVWALTKQLGVELARERVRINTLSPGYVTFASFRYLSSPYILDHLCFEYVFVD